MRVQEVVRRLYADYRSKNSVNGQPPLGDCQILAALICLHVPTAEPVGGVCYDDEDSGSHWWAELPDGTVLDPLGAEWQAGGVKEREELVRGVPHLVHALRRTWPDAPDILYVADRLQFEWNHHRYLAAAPPPCFSPRDNNPPTPVGKPVLSSRDE